MYNVNAPMTIPVNYYGGGVQSPPPNNLQRGSNVIGIGNIGYNGAYYGGNYTLYNPYLLEERRKAEEAQRKEQLRLRTDTMKNISKKVNKSLGNEMSDEDLKEIYDPVEFKTTQKDLDIQNSYRLMQINSYNVSMNICYNNPMYYAMGRQQVINQQKLDPDMDLNRFFEISGELISDSIKEEVLRERKNINNLYNRSEYQKLIDLRSGNGFAGTFRPNASIDDMEIQLPEHLKNEYQRRKEKFLEAIINRRSD